MSVETAAKLIRNSKDRSNSLVRWQGRSTAEKEAVIQAIYKQVLGNFHVMESERLVSSESRLVNGEISIKEFVKELANSQLYQSRFGDIPRFRQVELGFKHFLGRAPRVYTEISAGLAAYEGGSFSSLVNFFVDGEEFDQAFGEYIVPATRGTTTIGAQTPSGFVNTLKLINDAAGCDLAKTPVLEFQKSSVTTTAATAGIKRYTPRSVSEIFAASQPTQRSSVTPAPITPTAAPTQSVYSAPPIVSTGSYDYNAGLVSLPKTIVEEIAVGEPSLSFRGPTAGEISWEGQTAAEKGLAIRAIYKQVLGNYHVMESERLVVPESQFIKGEIGVREFIRQVATSALYQSRFGDTPRYRQVELGFKHFLGRAPIDYSEVSAGLAAYDSGNFEGLVDFFLASDEFQTAFGENSIPNGVRGLTTAAAQTPAGFVYSLQLLNRPSECDLDTAPVLDFNTATVPVPTTTTTTTVSSTTTTASTAATRARPSVGTPAQVAQPAAASGNLLNRIFGFVEGLLSSSSDSATNPQANTQQGDFFLSPDEAITLGNVEYMRTAKTVRRTFPNVKNLEKPLEEVKTVSAGSKETGEAAATKAKSLKTTSEVKIDVSLATQEKKKAEQPALIMPPMPAMTTGKLQPYVSASMSQEVSQRRSKDTSLDTFRKMARDLRK